MGFAMSEDVTWIISTGLAFVTVVGGVIARDRYILSLISKNYAGSTKVVQESNSQIHERINRVKDEYVRRVDLDTHITRLDASIQNMTQEMRNSAIATNQRLDTILGYFASDKRAAK